MALTTTFPTFGLSSVTGQKLVDWVTAHPDDSLGVKIALTMVPNQKYTEDKMSDFTSYGPVSNLSFKPDITAPGGNIWSTQNNNGIHKYVWYVNGLAIYCRFTSIVETSIE